MIELSDHVVRLNRRETTQLDLRLRQLKRQETIIVRSYEREIAWRRLQLAQFYDALNDDSSDSFTRNSRAQTPVSFYAIKMRRNQSAPTNANRPKTANQTFQRPNTTPAPIRRTKRAMSVFKEITLKPPYRTLGNLLVLLGNENNQLSKTMINR